MTFDPDHWQPIEDRTPNLRERFNYKNPQADEIAAVIARAEKRHTVWFDSHQAPWRLVANLKDRQDIPFVREVHEFFRDRLKDRVLISLGAVEIPLSKALASAPPKVIIHVDRYDHRIGPREAPLDPFAVTQVRHEPDEPLQWNIKADMLDVLSRIPSDSVNVELDGIDTVIIPDEEYHRVLAQELVRVLRPGGVLFGNHVDAFEHLRNNGQLIERRFMLTNDFYETRIFEKTPAIAPTESSA